MLAESLPGVPFPQGPQVWESGKRTSALQTGAESPRAQWWFRRAGGVATPVDDARSWSAPALLLSVRQEVLPGKP